MKTGRAKAILGSAAVQDRARGTEQICTGCSAATRMESVSDHIGDGSCSWWPGQPPVMK